MDKLKKTEKRLEKLYPVLMPREMKRRELNRLAANNG